MPNYFFGELPDWWRFPLQGGNTKRRESPLSACQCIRAKLAQPG